MFLGGHPYTSLTVAHQGAHHGGVGQREINSRARRCTKAAERVVAQLPAESLLVGIFDDTVVIDATCGLHAELLSGPLANAIVGKVAKSVAAGVE